ncbi:methyltransferase [Lacinutrix himadriensis]|uniref:methyltransferase n=1 Tax=Lacinutrix himadriensis TaxID=641549 RepID=UPI0006E3E1CE|nr:methyltransferase [Lacinutrix himadriensis]
MRRVIKKILDPFLKFGFSKYYKKPRKYSYENIEVLVYPEVFPPHLTISTKILLDFIKPLNLQNKSVLELGCGSGIISLFASSKGANVTASDINSIALDALKIASKKNNASISILNSDLFDAIKNKSFDYIIINPPYYPKNPENIKEQAWFCGEDFEYFKKLFQQLPNFLNNTNALMILSQDCNINKIQEIASENKLLLESVFEKKVFSEKNYIFKITRL